MTMFFKLASMVTVALFVFGCNTDNVRDSSPTTTKPEELSVQASENAKEGSSTISNPNEVSVPSNKVVIAKVDVLDGKIASIKTIQESRAKEGMITFRLSEIGGNRMMLSSKSTLDMIVKFDIEIIDDLGKREYTSSCPIMPKAGALQSWEHKIPELKINNFRILKDTSSLACK